MSEWAGGRVGGWVSAGGSRLSALYLEVFESMVHDTLKQLISGSIAGCAHQDARLASQVGQCTVQS